MWTKKGYTISDIAPIVMTLAIAIIATVVMVNINTGIVDSNDCASGYTWNEAQARCLNSTNGWATGAGETNATMIARSGVQGFDEIGSWFGTIGLVIAAAIIVGLLVYAFSFKK